MLSFAELVKSLLDCKTFAARPGGDGGRSGEEFINRAKKTAGAGGVISSQVKHVTKMKSEMIGASGTSYEPLLERYIGNKVVLEIAEADNIIEYCGVLKEYTAEFIEVMDVSLKPEQGARQDDKMVPRERKADVVVLRKIGIIRHLGE